MSFQLMLIFVNTIKEIHPIIAYSDKSMFE